MRSRSTGCTRCAMRSTVVLRGATSIVRGSSQHAVGERADLVGERGGEQQVLPRLGSSAMTRRTSGMNPMSSMRSASSSTKISTCEKSTLPWPWWSSRRPGVATRMSTPRRSCAACPPKPTPPKIAADAILRVLAVGAHRRLDLRRELARGGEDQRAQRRAAGCASGTRRQALQHRQHEAGGLAGAGLRAGEDVAAGEHGGNRLALDGGGEGVALVGDRAHEHVGQPEFCKRHVNLRMAMLGHSSQRVGRPVIAKREETARRSEATAARGLEQTPRAALCPESRAEASTFVRPGGKRPSRLARARASVAEHLAPARVGRANQ